LKQECRRRGLGGCVWGGLGGASAEGAGGNPTASPGKGERPLYKTVHEITHDTEKADDKFHFIS